jgi:anti-sigma B factor antagonist
VPERFRFTLQEGHDGIVVKLRGELDLGGAEPLAGAMLSAIRNGSNVSVDLSELTFIDSSGLSAFVRAGRLAREQDVHFDLAHATPEIMQTFVISGMESYFSWVDGGVEPSAADAE